MAVDGLKILENGYDSVVSALTDIAGNVTPTQVAIGTIVAGAGVGGVIVAKVTKKRKSTKRKTRKKKKTKRGRKRDRMFISKQKHEKRYIKRKKKAGKKITRKRYKTRKNTKKRTGKTYYTKKGQPYKIMASGKARFIKKTKRGTKR